MNKFKINVDAAIIEDTSKYECCWVARHSAGHPAEVQTFCKQGLLRPVVAEMLDIEAALVG